MAIISKGIKSSGAEGADTKPKQRKPKPGMAEFIAGEAKEFNANLTPFLPNDLVGGSIPQVPGMETEGVWNAASQACGRASQHARTCPRDRPRFCELSRGATATLPASVRSLHVSDSCRVGKSHRACEGRYPTTTAPAG